MLKSAKLVLFILTACLAMSAIPPMLAGGTSSRSIISLVIQIAALGGLYARNPLAWFWVRWTSPIGGLFSFFLAFVTMTSTQMPMLITALLLIGGALNFWIFYLIGKTDSKAYFRRLEIEPEGSPKPLQPPASGAA